MPLDRRFEAERERRELTTKALAARLRVAQCRVRAVEKGSRHAFQPDLCHKMVRALEIEGEDDSRESALDDVARAYRLRFLARFAVPCGLVEAEPPSEALRHDEEARVRSTPQLERFAELSEEPVSSG